MATVRIQVSQLVPGDRLRNRVVVRTARAAVQWTGDRRRRIAIDFLTDGETDAHRVAWNASTMLVIERQNQESA